MISIINQVRIFTVNSQKFL